MAVAVGTFILTKVGRGPFAPGAARPDDGTSIWLRPGPRHVIPWIVTLSALAILPLGVYIVTYAESKDTYVVWCLLFHRIKQQRCVDNTFCSQAVREENYRGRPFIIRLSYSLQQRLAYVCAPQSLQAVDEALVIACVVGWL